MNFKVKSMINMSLMTLGAILALVHSGSALANAFANAELKYERGEPLRVELLGPDDLVLRGGACADIFTVRNPVSRAFLRLNVASGTDVYLGFEAYNDRDTDEDLINDALDTRRDYWSDVAELPEETIQLARGRLGERLYLSYRIFEDRAGNQTLVRKYYSEAPTQACPNFRSRCSRHQLVYIDAYEAIEYCTISLGQPQ